MAYINLNNVDVDFPVYDIGARSIKNDLMRLTTGGNVKRAKGKTEVSALRNINLTIKDGERVGLIGHNGAGKTTLLRLLSKVYHPTSGVVNIEGKIGSLIAISLGISDDFSGRDNIYTRGCLLGFKKKEIDNKIEEIINFSELGEFIDMPVRTYSSGMAMRLAFSISTILSPEILLMDEWLSVGDEGFKEKAEARLTEIVRNTKILVIASHSRNLLDKKCTRIIWLEHGQIIDDGVPDEILPKYFK